jgi:hypothetical protein
MKRFVEGVDRGPSTLFPADLDDRIDEDNAVRAIDVFVDEPDLGKLGFVRVDAKPAPWRRAAEAPVLWVTTCRSPTLHPTAVFRRTKCAKPPLRI